MFPSSEYEYELGPIPYNAALILDISRSRHSFSRSANPGQCADNPGHLEKQQRHLNFVLS